MKPLLDASPPERNWLPAAPLANAETQPSLQDGTDREAAANAMDCVDGVTGPDGSEYAVNNCPFPVRVAFCFTEGITNKGAPEAYGLRCGDKKGDDRPHSWFQSIRILTTRDQEKPYGEYSHVKHQRYIFAADHDNFVDGVLVWAAYESSLVERDAEQMPKNARLQGYDGLRTPKADIAQSRAAHAAGDRGYF